LSVVSAVTTGQLHFSTNKQTLKKHLHTGTVLSFNTHSFIQSIEQLSEVGTLVTSWIIVRTKWNILSLHLQDEETGTKKLSRLTKFSLLVGGGLGIELGGLIPEFYILPTPLT
jgi:hypothetical protein